MVANAEHRLFAVCGGLRSKLLSLTAKAQTALVANAEHLRPIVSVDSYVFVGQIAPVCNGGCAAALHVNVDRDVAAKKNGLGKLLGEINAASVLTH